MKTFKILGVIILAMVAGIFIWAAILPSSFTVESRVYIKNTRQTVYESIIDFKEWKHWSPWHDSTTLISYSGNISGEGAIMSWKNDQMQIGEMTIEECNPDSFVVIKLKAFETMDSSYIRFEFKDYIDSIQVAFIYDGEGYNYFLGRFEGFIIKKAMEGSSRIGLNRLKKHVETKPEAPDYFGYEIEEIELPQRLYVGLRDSCETAEVDALYDHLKTWVEEKLRTSDLKTVGSPICVWESFNPKGYSVIKYGYPIDMNSSTDIDLDLFYLPASMYIRTKVIGDYNSETAPWVALRNYMQQHKYKISHFAFEEFEVGLPAEQDTSAWVTYNYYPIAKEFKSNE